jgi:hypothetical protein
MLLLIVILREMLTPRQPEPARLDGAGSDVKENPEPNDERPAQPQGSYGELCGADPHNVRGESNVAAERLGSGGPECNQATRVKRKALTGL